MPYIPKEDRKELDDVIADLPALRIGEMNYVITRLCHQYLDLEGECYDVYNELIGVLESAKMELYRRRIADYEDIKIKENGDV